MPTTNERINVTFPPALGELVGLSAKRDKVSKSKKIIQLVEEALDLEEDMLLGQIALGRDTLNAKFIPHDKFWTDVFNRVSHKGKRRRS